MSTETATEPRPVPASPPPRRSVRWWMMLLVAVGVVAALVSGVIFAESLRKGVALIGFGDSHEHEEAGWWTCGMHPWVVVRSSEGGCPICHMDLIPLDPSQFTGTLSIDPIMVQNIGVRVGEVTLGPLDRQIRTVGSVVVDETAVYDVNTRFSGWIESLNVDQTGQEVEEGQALFTVFSPELYAATEELRLAESAAGEAGATTRGIRSDLLAAARQKLRLFGLAEEEINRLTDEEGREITLLSPTAGTVLEKNAAEGMRIEPGMRVYRIADLSRVWVEASVYETDLPMISIGQPATMTLPYLPGDEFEGEVTFISPTLDPQTRQATVRLEFENAERLLKPGMFAQVELNETLRQEVTLVPREAVLDTGQEQRVILSRGEGRFEPRAVTLGRPAAGGLVEVLEGVEPGEKVVTSGQFLLDSEARIRESLARMLEGETPADAEPAAPVVPADTLALPTEAAEAINNVLRPYLAISDALSRDSLEDVPAQAERLQEAAQRLAPETPSLDAPALAAAARELTNATGDLKAARLAFAQVSTQIVPLAKQTGVPATFDDSAGRVTALQCPMFPPGEASPWLQLGTTPRNPYMGERMLGCFDERQTLATTPVATDAP